MKMKKLLALALALLMVVTLVACATPEQAPPTPTPADTPAPAETPTPDDDNDDPVVEDDEPFPGIIAIVTNTIDQNEEEFRSAAALVERFGEDKVMHRTWPVYFLTEPEQMRTTLVEIASNLDVGAIIINQAVPNTNAAIDAVREIRGDDIFIVVCSAAEDPADV
ncbi:MAG: DUF3798 domain-containing protein, partial [Oscillospiraceae bacterium]|nr:DUF3798 domain-containing protein [Oscillospiraceae bacterium]